MSIIVTPTNVRILNYYNNNLLFYSLCLIKPSFANYNTVLFPERVRRLRNRIRTLKAGLYILFISFNLLFISITISDKQIWSISYIVLTIYTLQYWTSVRTILVVPMAVVYWAASDRQRQWSVYVVVISVGIDVIQKLVLLLSNRPWLIHNHKDLGALFILLYFCLKFK